MGGMGHVSFTNISKCSGPPHPPDPSILFNKSLMTYELLKETP